LKPQYDFSIEENIKVVFSLRSIPLSFFQATHKFQEGIMENNSIQPKFLNWVLNTESGVFVSKDSSRGHVSCFFLS
jgi:hypothetical protein